MAHIDCLPTEILQQIFSFSKDYEIQTISEVCHRWADAAQLLMMKRTCLIVRGQILDALGENTQLKMISHRMLQRSNRKYTCLEFEWEKEETTSTRCMLNRRLDLCQERFPTLQRLHLNVPPNRTLVQFFNKRKDWLKNLTELYVEFKQLGETSGRKPSEDPIECKILLPNLKRLYCMMNRHDGSLQGGPFETVYAFTLNVPELCCLTVEMDEGSMANGRPSRFQEPDVCCLFLPTLKLKTSSKLERLQMDSVAELNQRHIDNSEQFLKNLKVLELTWCSPEITLQMWEKCSNLKELVIKLDSSTNISRFLNVSPAMSQNLEKLTLSNCSLQLDHRAVFAKLKCITWDLQFTDAAYDDLHLVAPQLISLRALCTESSRIVVRHEEQIRSMELTMGHWIMHGNPPPPNVTELTLRWPYGVVSAPRIVQDYLAYFPNLQRLKIYGRDVLYSLDFPAVSKLLAIPRLQFFFAERVTLRLSDLRKFTGLQTLVLSECIIKTKPNDDDGGEVVLPALQYCRVQQVAIDGYGRNRFPIRVDGRLSPAIDVVCVSSANERNVFSSRIRGMPQPFFTRRLSEPF